MAVEFLVNRLKTLFILLLGALRRAMCCFRRRRRSSCDSIPLSAVGVIPNSTENHTDLEQWEQWEENPVIVVSDKPVDIIQAKIQQYRQQIAKPSEQSEEEKQVNFFEDMTPKITRQTKVILREKNTVENNWGSSKFAVASEQMPTNELGEWEENAVGWEGETVEEFGDPTVVIREEKRKEREQRLFKQHQRRMERGIRPQPLGAKIGS